MDALEQDRLARHDTAATSPTQLQNSPGSATDAVHYILEDLVHRTKWYVIYEICDGKETFTSQEYWEQGKWRPHQPARRELEAARELRAQGKARDGWSTTLSIDERIVALLTDVGHFPACIKAAVRELAELKVNAADNAHVRFATELNTHAVEGRRTIDSVYKFLERHRYYRAMAKKLGMIDGSEPRSVRN